MRSSVCFCNIAACLRRRLSASSSRLGALVYGGVRAIGGGRNGGGAARLYPLLVRASSHFAASKKMHMNRSVEYTPSSRTPGCAKDCLTTLSISTNTFVTIVDRWGSSGAGWFIL